MTGKDGDAVLIIDSRACPEITDELLRGAIEELRGSNIGFSRVSVNGALEIAPALRLALMSGMVGRATHHRGCLALGCIVRCKYPDYDLVAYDSSMNLRKIAMNHALPLGLGVLTCETMEQAWERASVDAGNKGGNAARACITLMRLQKSIECGQHTCR